MRTLGSNFTLVVLYSAFLGKQGLRSTSRSARLSVSQLHLCIAKL